MQEKLLNAKEVADIMHISVRTLDRYVETKILPQPIKLASGKRGARRYWTLSDINKFINANRVA